MSADLQALIDARVAELNAQRQMVGHVVDLQPPAVALATGQVYPAAVLSGLQLGVGDRVMLLQVGHGYVIMGQVDAVGIEDIEGGGTVHDHDELYSPLGHDHAATYAALEHDTAHDDRFSQLGHSHTSPTGLAKVYRGSDQSIAADTEITWTAGLTDGNTIAGLSHSSGGVWQIDNAGLYLFHAHTVWAGTSGGGFRRVWLLINNDTKVVGHAFSHASVNIVSTATLLWLCSAGDNVRVNVRQSSGGALNLIGDIGTSFQTRLYIARLA